MLPNQKVFFVNKIYRGIIVRLISISSRSYWFALPHLLKQYLSQILKQLMKDLLLSQKPEWKEYKWFPVMWIEWLVCQGNRSLRDFCPREGWVWSYPNRTETLPRYGEISKRKRDKTLFHLLQYLGICKYKHPIVSSQDLRKVETRERDK